MTYEEMLRFVKGGRNGWERRKSKNTVLRHIEDPEMIKVLLHGHAVVIAYPDGSYKLDSCGWRTSTTKARINEYAPIYISQRKFEWWLSRPGGRNIPFIDGMKLIPCNGGYKIEEEAHR